MNPRKRQASDPLLPLRSSKVFRTTEGDSPPSLPSRWFDHLFKLGREALSYLTLPVEENDSDIRLSSTYLPPARFRTPDAPLTSRQPSEWFRSPAPPPSTPVTPRIGRQRSPSSPHFPRRRRRSLTPSPLYLLPRPPLLIMSAQTTTPQLLPSSSSKLLRHDNSQRQTLSNLDNPMIAAHESVVRQNSRNHIHPQSELSSAHAPPPSSQHSSAVPLGRSASTNSASTLPVMVSLPALARSIPHSSLNGSITSIGQSLDSATRQHRSKDSFYGIPRNYQNREHIYAKQHKSAILTQQKKDREDMIKELYQLKRSAGYTSDFSTFQGYLDYGERLLLLERRGALSPSPSLTDLRSRNRVPAPNRRHSVSGDFLERALEKAREALNGPRPPKPFHPSLDQLQISARAKDEEIERRLRGPKRAPLPDHLPLEDEAEVDAFMRMKGVVSKFAREQVTDRDLSRLGPCQWLNDEIINFYGQLIVSQADACKENPGINGVNGVEIVGGKNKALNVHYFSTFFWSKLKSEGYEKGRLAKWTKKFDLFQKDIILVPINHNNSHWTAAAINFRRKRIESYDSMNMDRREVYKLLRAYVDAEHRNKKKKPFDFTGWEDHFLLDTPQQENGFDCGVFTCQFLASLARGEETFNFSQGNMDYIRRRMVWEIGHATLRDDA